MRILHCPLFPFACLALLGVLACSRSGSPVSTTESKPAPAAGAASSPAVTPPGWKTVTIDKAKTCQLSIPPNWEPPSPNTTGMFANPRAKEMVMLVEDEEARRSGNWNLVHEEILAQSQAPDTKVEILEDSATGFTFQLPRWGGLATVVYRRSPKTLCAVQITVPKGDPSLQTLSRQIAASLQAAP